MNTNKIITAYKENEPKIKIINDLSSEIEEAIGNKNKIFYEINKKFQVVFHNFATERIKTGVIITDSRNNKWVVYINKEGISIRGDSQYNSEGSTTNIFNMFIEFLKLLKEKELDVMQHIKKKQKQDIFHNFLEDVDLLETDDEYKKSFDIHFFDEDEEEVSDELTANSRSIEFGKRESSWNNKSFHISKNNIGLRDKLIIEQLFEEVKVMLEEYLVKEKQALKNAELFLDGIKNKFNAQLMVAELKKQK